ncbi:MAG: hypothetical protein PHQ43_09210 [Dehalococcoidales bacterium]|nr:hypothetical protein [Dehalococcoidales bacterium]
MTEGEGSLHTAGLIIGAISVLAILAITFHHFSMVKAYSQAFLGEVQRVGCRVNLEAEEKHVKA